MAAIEWNVDLAVEAAGSAGWLSFMMEGGITVSSLGALQNAPERIWFYPSSNSEFGRQVTNGATLFIGSFAGEALHHWLSFPNTAENLVWEKWTAFDTSNAWIITTTDGSTDVNEGTSFVLQAGSGGGFMALSSSGNSLLTTTSSESDAIVFTASLSASPATPLPQVFRTRG